MKNSDMLDKLDDEQIKQVTDCVNASKIIAGYIISEVGAKAYGNIEIAKIMRSLITEDYEKLASIECKNISREYILRTEKLIKEHDPDEFVETKNIFDYVFKGASVAESFINGTHKTINRTEAIAELSDLVTNNQITPKQFIAAQEVFDCYDSAQHFIKKYEDVKIYNYLRKRSRQAYKENSDKSIQQILEKYIPKEFFSTKLTLKKA